MDFTKNVVLKENYTFLVADADGQVATGERGLYHRDTRYLSRYAWRFGDGVQTLLAHTSRPDRFHAHYALIDGPSQLIGYRRELRIAAGRVTDTLQLDNTSGDAREVNFTLELGSDFADLFEARGWMRLERPTIAGEVQRDRLSYRYTAKDGLTVACYVRFSPAPESLTAEHASFALTLGANETVTLEIIVDIESAFEADRRAPHAIGYEAWREGFDISLPRERDQAVLEQAIMDLRALLLFTDHGPVPAAGIPWYVAAFGRDALLTAYMLLPYHPEVAEGTLRYLAAHQGKRLDPARAEAPGKIMHELRFGELTRLGETPHSPYYGTIDATALFVVLLHRHWQMTGELALVNDLKPHWEAALAWMTEHGDIDGDGFLEFIGAELGKGLVVQSWKDSHDSMSHADGALATGTLAVSEVQGYAYAAYGAAAEFYAALGEAEQASSWRERAAALKAAFHQAFWLDDLSTYAMALDGDKRPLRVQNSDAGHLLWSGIVPESVAPSLVHTLMSDENWSGWGIRTLGKREARYNPVSYHNGSVWPHDTALIAGGMARYGFREEAARIRAAIFDLAATQSDRRLPELIAGYERSDAPPVPYPVACRPQAWDAAALLYLLRL